MFSTEGVFFLTWTWAGLSTWNVEELCMNIEHCKTLLYLVVKISLQMSAHFIHVRGGTQKKNEIFSRAIDLFKELQKIH